MTRDQAWWDRYFVGMAEYVSKASKDPSTKVGAVIVRPDKTVVSTGYNGFPRGIKDDHRLDDRPTKYEIILHAEDNAILTAHGDVRGCTIYLWPLPPCSRCAARLIQAGIARVVSPQPTMAWAASCKLGRDLLQEANVNQCTIFNEEPRRAVEEVTVSSAW